MNWQQIETELRSRPLQSGSPAESFWSEFRQKTVDAKRNESAPEPIGIGRWLSVVAVAAAIVVAVFVLRPAPVEPSMRLASTEVISVDVVASHAGVVIMTYDDTANGTVLWIADLDLTQTEEN